MQIRDEIVATGYVQLFSRLSKLFLLSSSPKANTSTNIITQTHFKNRAFGGEHQHVWVEQEDA